MTEKTPSKPVGATPEVNPPLPEVKPAAAPKAKGLVPVFAIHKITYGAGQTAVPHSIFTPTTVAERDELFGMGAVRELDKTEATLFAKGEPIPDADEGEFE